MPMPNGSVSANPQIRRPAKNQYLFDGTGSSAAMALMRPNVPARARSMSGPKKNENVVPKQAGATPSSR